MALNNSVLTPNIVPYYMSQVDKYLNISNIAPLYPELLNNSDWRYVHRKYFQICEIYHKEPSYLFRSDYGNTELFGCYGLAAGSYDAIHKDFFSWFNRLYGDISVIYGCISSVFGFLGMLILSVLIVMLLRNKSHMTAFWMIALVQAIIMFFLLLEHSTLEAALYFKQANLFYGEFLQCNHNSDQCSGGLFFETQNFDQYMMFINYSLTIATALMRLFKALDRFSKMVFPYSYLKIFSIRKTCFVCCIGTLFCLVLFSPWAILGGKIGTFNELINFILIIFPAIAYRLLLNDGLYLNLQPYIYILNVTGNLPSGMACIGHSLDAAVTLIVLYRWLKVEKQMVVYVANSVPTTFQQIK